MANFSKIFGLAGSVVVFAGMAFGQSNPATCTAPTSTTNIIRAEGTTEQVATVTFTCTNNSGAAQTAGIGVNAQVFITPALPVTSQVLSTSTGKTEASLAITSSAGGTSTIQGTVSGSTINFSGTTPATAPLPAGGTLTFTISNVRVNASSLSVGAGVPPSISETVFVSGPSVIPTALASSTVAFAQNGLGATKTFKTFTVPAGGAFPTGAGTSSGVNGFVICNPYSPKIDAYAGAVGAASGKSLAAVVEVNENFAQAFRTAADEASQAAVGQPSAAISTRIKLNFANVPSNVTVYVPVGPITSLSGAAQITLVTSETGSTVATASSSSSVNGLAVAAVSGSAIYSVTTDDLTNLDKFDIPVFVVTTANTVPGSSTAMTVTATLGPVGSTSFPNFVVGSSSSTTTLSTFSLCTTSLLFPFVTNQLGFDTGIAISNTSTDPFGSAGATAQSGTCTLNFYGAGAPTPSAVTLPTSAAGNTVASGSTGAVVVSSVAAGFQGYVIAQCAFQYAHGFAFIQGPAGLSHGYLAGVIPDTNQKSRGADPLSVAGAGSGETLGN